MKFLLIDGNSIINRAFYAIRPLTAPDGTNTNAVLGFFNTYLRVAADEAPDGVCVCFDVHAPTFRKKMYDAYKAGRHATPPELIEQIPLLKELLTLCGLTHIELEGYEADDLLGTLSRVLSEMGHQTVILTGDRDSLQLVGDHTKVKIASTKSGQPIITDYDPSKIYLDFGVTPIQLIQVKALMGDASDNIPGVPGVGEKTALSLIAKAGTVENLYQNPDTFSSTASIKKKLIEGRESAELSLKLAEINCRVPIKIVPEQLLISSPRAEAATRFRELGLVSLMERLNLTESEPEIEKISIPNTFPLTSDHIPVEKSAFLLSREVLTVYDGKTLFTLNRSDSDSYSVLKAYFSDSSLKITHDLKSALSLLLIFGIEAKGEFFDTLTASALLGAQENIPELTGRYLKKQFTPGGETLALFSLYGIMQPLLKPYNKLYHEIELPLSRTIAGMEYQGFTLDTTRLEDYGKGLALMAADDEAKIYAIAGTKFNINSPKQLGEILFEKMGLPVIKKTKSGYSTDADVLNKLSGKSDIIGLILEYRSLTKLKSTYVDGLPKGIQSRDGRVHSTFFQTGAITGRISSSEPNLQNIPVRTPLGRELRKMFIARDGFLLADADYSQIELRLLAHIANDRVLIEAFQEGEDIHTLTASQVFGIPLFAVTPDMRSKAKAVNFGIIYGISDFALAEDIGVSRREAKEYIERYLDSYPGVKQYMKDIVEFARDQGYVETMFGRRRYIPDIHAKNFNLRSAAERIALNAPIQGSAADLIKLAMVQLDRRLLSESPDSHLILQIHDELIVEAPEADAGRVALLVEDCMETVASCRVPLTAEASVGKSWYDAKK